LGCLKQPLSADPAPVSHPAMIARPVTGAPPAQPSQVKPFQPATPRPIRRRRGYPLSPSGARWTPLRRLLSRFTVVRSGSTFAGPVCHMARWLSNSVGPGPGNQIPRSGCQPDLHFWNCRNSPSRRLANCLPCV